MICCLCTDFTDYADKSSPFYVGTSAKSKAHAKCQFTKRAKEVPKTMPMAMIASKMNKEKFEVLRKLFRTAYYVAKKEIALAKFPGLCKLQIANGVDLSNTYMNDHTCCNFIEAMAHVHGEDMKSQI